MRDFSWKYFALTGDVEAYMLFKEIDTKREDGEFEEEADQDEMVN